ncbi:hypothetical protein FACS1894166_02590 [Bacilli bacterium]|nr:hypothetical protein FACS1894166_02590 [Bacilli bacterium]
MTYNKRMRIINARENKNLIGDEIDYEPINEFIVDHNDIVKPLKPRKPRGMPP